MRKVTYGGAVSLDGFLARPDGGVDWLMWSDEAAAATMASWEGVDTVVTGRKTYEVAARQRAGGRGEFPGVASYVCSRTLAADAVPGATVVADAVGLVRRLKGEPGKDIILMGGGDLARSLFEAGLIDEVGFNVHPVLLGAGVPAFHPMTRQTDLELKECRPFKNGCVLLTYRVKR
ncbi:MAG: dihydrofolate reductase family protein [Gemmataceae bacterium]|nr:dihydrofolate reductase family protein [Gemmataceae bacterium]